MGSRGVWGSAVQFRVVSTYLANALGFSAIADGLAVVEQGGYARLIYGQRGGSALNALDLGAVSVPLADPGDPWVGTSGGSLLSVQSTSGQPRVFVASAWAVPLQATPLVPALALGAPATVSSSLGTLSGVTAFEIIERGATDIAVVAQRGIEGLRIFSLSDAGGLTLIGSLSDGPKATVLEVTDLASVLAGGQTYLLVLSALENGISSYQIGPTGVASFIDTMGMRDGLAVNGPVAMQVAELGGQDFAVIAATGSSSLSVVRINPMGVLFQTDHLIDDRTTRFADVAALDMFVAQDRVFVVAAGSDAGLTVLELLPGGRLAPYLTVALETGQGMANVTGIEAQMMSATRAALLLTDARGDRINHFELDLSALGQSITASGGTVTGTALDDRILGSAAAEVLQGGAGNDWIYDGGGSDQLRGGAGADVFVFARDGAVDRVLDFERGIDRLDVRDWGRIYGIEALTLTATSTGATVSYGNEQVILTASNNAALTLTAADFLF